MKTSYLNHTFAILGIVFLVVAKVATAHAMPTAYAVTSDGGFGTVDMTSGIFT